MSHFPTVLKQHCPSSLLPSSLVIRELSALLASPTNSTVVSITLMWEMRCFTSLRALSPAAHRCHPTTMFKSTKPRIDSSAVPALPRNHHTHATSIADAPIKPKTPLCERKPIHTTRLAGLISWHRDALTRIAFIGDAWMIQDDGPSQEDLETELSWLLDDSVAALIDETGAPERSITWRSLERDIKTGALLLPDSCTIKLREPLANLGKPGSA